MTQLISYEDSDDVALVISKTEAAYLLLLVSKMALHNWKTTDMYTVLFQDESILEIRKTLMLVAKKEGLVVPTLNIVKTGE